MGLLQNGEVNPEGVQCVDDVMPADAAAADTDDMPADTDDLPAAPSSSSWKPFLCDAIYQVSGWTMDIAWGIAFYFLLIGNIRRGTSKGKNKNYPKNARTYSYWCKICIACV